LAAFLAGIGLVLIGPGPSTLAQIPVGAAVALTGARVIDGTGAPPIESATILIAGARIQAAGANVAIPAGATRVDLSGKTIVPGFVNAHGHLNANRGTAGSVREALERQLRLYADYGVTTVQVLGLGFDSLDQAMALRDEQNADRLNRARVYLAAPSLQSLQSPDEARARVNEYADRHVDIVKMHINGNANDMTPDVYGALIEQAHQRGLRVAAHLYYLKDAKGLVDRGLDVIAHSIRDQPVDAAIVAAIKSRNVGYVPTLTRDLAQFVYESTPPFFSDPFFLRHADAYQSAMTTLRDPASQARMRNDPRMQGLKDALAQGSRNLKVLSDAGVLIGMGTDSGANERQWQGYFEHIELELMVNAGLTPMQTIVAATSGAARIAHVDSQLGSIAAGKQADLLVLDDNPLTDVRNTRKIHSVWIAGTRLPDGPATN
jgi:imidazolonepropionase-like amidohydrolase